MLSSATVLEIAQFGILFASIILHEVSHGWSALALGDDTAKRAGRLSLNPLVHIDPLGSIIVPALLLISHTGVLFGWAKPVPVNVGRLRHPRNGAVITSLAGPAMNIALAAIVYVVLRVVHPALILSFNPANAGRVVTWPFYLLFYAGLINIWLACFNLIPVPPLDGSALVERALPRRHWGTYLAIRPYTMLLMFGVVIIGNKSGAFSSAFNWIAYHWQSATGYG